MAACTAVARPPCLDDPAQAAAHYITMHHRRLDDPANRAQGYQMGSGTMECGCKQVDSQRLKVPGATWDKAGACLVTKTRAAVLSDQWAVLAHRRMRLPQPA